jgi:hypothetical protein
MRNGRRDSFDHERDHAILLPDARLKRRFIVASRDHDGIGALGIGHYELGIVN